MEKERFVDFEKSPNPFQVRLWKMEVKSKRCMIANTLAARICEFCERL